HRHALRSRLRAFRHEGICPLFRAVPFPAGGGDRLHGKGSCGKGGSSGSRTRFRFRDALLAQRALRENLHQGRPPHGGGGLFKLLLRGKGGHGSLPQFARNPLDCGAEIMAKCPSITPEGCVLTFCTCRGGTNNSVIPDEALLMGTVRFLDPLKGKKMVEDFTSLVRSVSERRGIQADFSCPVPYLPLIHRKEDVERVEKFVRENMGEEAFFRLPAHVMSSEDFSFYLQKYPGVFVHLGSGNSSPLHSAGFDFDDKLLATGIRYFCILALDLFRD
ncbi:MAG: peptidase dimerization domain-containing protein, partial [Lentisphaeria bacterium]|nr:peptidase dimerization domain-containing protein [Lentisphaeria bacterium]